MIVHIGDTAQADIVKFTNARGKQDMAVTDQSHDADRHIGRLEGIIEQMVKDQAEYRQDIACHIKRHHRSNG